MRVCGRRLSVQVSKGAYTCFFCLGQKNDPAGACREPYVPADKFEREVPSLYQRLQLPKAWLARLQEEMAAEAIDQQHGDAAQREFLTHALAKAEGQRRKLLDAYYSNAIDVTTLKHEQERVGRDITAAKDKLSDLDANLTEWQEILTLAGQFATHCADAYRKADDNTRRLFNTAVFEHLDVKDGRLAEISYQPPFDALFVPQFEYGTPVVQRYSCSNPADLREVLGSLAGRRRLGACGVAWVRPLPSDMRGRADPLVWFVLDRSVCEKPLIPHHRPTPPRHHKIIQMETRTSLCAAPKRDDLPPRKPPPPGPCGSRPEKYRSRARHEVATRSWGRRTEGNSDQYWRAIRLEDDPSIRPYHLCRERSTPCIWRNYSLSVWPDPRWWRRRRDIVSMSYCA